MATYATKKFLDADGLTYFASLLNNYPDNEVLGVVINAIQDALDQKVDIADIHDPETMANVKTMLAKYGLDTTTVYTENTADTATAGGSVLTQ